MPISQLPSRRLWPSSPSEWERAWGLEWKGKLIKRLREARGRGFSCFLSPPVACLRKDGLLLSESQATPSVCVRAWGSGRMLRGSRTLIIFLALLSSASAQSPDRDSPRTPPSNNPSTFHLACNATGAGRERRGGTMVSLAKVTKYLAVGTYGASRAPREPPVVFDRPSNPMIIVCLHPRCSCRGPFADPLHCGARAPRNRAAHYRLGHRLHLRLPRRCVAVPRPIIHPNCDGEQSLRTQSPPAP